MFKYRDKIDGPFNDFVVQLILDLTYGEVKIKNRNMLNLNHNSLRNIFYTEEHEINIDKINFKKYECNIYPLVKSSELNFRIGCELETCILTKCLKDEADEILDKIKINNGISDNRKRWVSLIKIFITDVVLHNPSKEFIKLFPYIYIAEHPHKGVDIRINSETKDIEEHNEFAFNDMLIFTRDESVICGDSKKVSSPDKTFHCEIISPVLKNNDEVEIFYENIFRNHCLSSNDSAGFHINISLSNKQNNPIYYSRGFMETFLNYFERYENLNYDRFRPKGTKFAKKILTYAQEYTYKYISSFINCKDKEYFYDNFISGKNYYRSFIDFSDMKYNTIRLKNPLVLEMRLFPSRDNKDDILSFIKDANLILSETINDYSKNYKKIINIYQKRNLENEVDFEPLRYFKGYLYYSTDFAMEGLDKKLSNLNSALEFLFDLHQQSVVDIIKNNSKTYTINTSDESGDEKVYTLEILEDKRVEIKLK